MITMLERAVDPTHTTLVGYALLGASGLSLLIWLGSPIWRRLFTAPPEPGIPAADRPPLRPEPMVFEGEFLISNKTNNVAIGYRCPNPPNNERTE
jgi:hypothetical protein